MIISPNAPLVCITTRPNNTILYKTMNEKIYIGKVSLRTKVLRALWNVAYALLFRPFVTKLFRPWRLLLLKLFGAHVSWRSEVYASARIWAPWNLTLKAGSCLGPHTTVYNQAMVTLERDACLSQYSYICTAGHDGLNNARTGLVVAPVILCEGAWVGMDAYINMGVTIGQRAVVGARASVFGDVAPQTTVGGNPARILETKQKDSVNHL